MADLQDDLGERTCPYCDAPTDWIGSNRIAFKCATWIGINAPQQSLRCKWTLFKRKVAAR